jgi:hypothetical protein
VLFRWRLRRGNFQPQVVNQPTHRADGDQERAGGHEPPSKVDAEEEREKVGNEDQQPHSRRGAPNDERHEEGAASDQEREAHQDQEKRAADVTGNRGRIGSLGRPLTHSQRGVGPSCLSASLGRGEGQCERKGGRLRQSGSPSPFSPLMPSYPRRCPKCGLMREEEGFGVDRSKTSGRKSHCKTCDRERAKAYYAEHRDELYARREAVARQPGRPISSN